MKHTSRFTQFISALILLMSSCLVLANDVNRNEKNTGLNDHRVPSQYLPIEYSATDDLTSYTFIDRKTIKLHPYNDLIRVYTRIVNYDPIQFLDKDGEMVPYRSIVIQEYANCDKKMFAKSIIQTHENYFGEGVLQNTNDTPRRWESTASDSKERQNLIVICSLPLTH